jgi:dimeric dUTPase (all-alpha-NTP-PPase superfamily)
MIISDNTELMVYRMVDQQLNSQINIYKKNIATTDYIREIVLSAIDEVFEFESEIIETYSGYGHLTPTPAKGLDRVTEELIDIIHFVINVGLYLVRNELNEHVTSRDVDMKEEQQICTRLSGIIHDSIIGLSNHPLVIPDNINQIDYFSGRSTSVIRCLSNILRATPWKTWKQKQQFNFSEAFIHYQVLIRSVCELADITNIENTRDMYDYFMTKTVINIQRKIVGY